MKKKEGIQMTIGVGNIFGILLIIVLIMLIGVYSGRKVKDASDFTTGGGGAGALMVCGAIMGSLVSGQATIGTAQLAFTYGLSAWWFTLGAGIGCLILGIGYVVPLRNSGNMTLNQIIGEEYGQRAEYIGSVLCSIGIFISVIAQVIATSALLMTIFHMNEIVACVVAAAVMIMYVSFGGAWGAGMGGVAKLILLYVSCIIGFCVVMVYSGGFASLYHSVSKLLVGTELGKIAGLTTAADVKGRYLSLVARGPMKDIGSGLSLILGVLATQTYAQAIWSGKNHSLAKKGAFLAALCIPPIGIACTLIGLFMRGHFITADEVATLKQAGESIPSGLMQITSSTQVFPMFVLHYMPQFVGGIVLGTLLITVIGGGAGLTLGMATIIVNDILVKINKKLAKGQANLLASRVTIIGVLATSVVVAAMVPGAIINDFGFLSMGIRGTVVFVPMTTALFFKGKINSKFVVASSVAGPLAVLAGNCMNLPFDALFLGLGVCLIIMLAGTLFNKRQPVKEVVKE